MRQIALSVLPFWLIPFLLLTEGAQAAPLTPALKLQQTTQHADQHSQHKIDQLDEETQALLAEYRHIQNSLEELHAYNQQLARQVQDQHNEIARLDSERLEIEKTRRHIVPFMLEMQAVFDQFITLDIPFLPKERQMRQQQLHALMDRADISLAEKFRRLLEAYRVEAEYGHTLETYQDELVTENTRTVDFLRLGRAGLFYLTLDEAEAGFWNPREQRWERLENQYKEAIKQGILIARKQLPPNLIRLPFLAPEGVQ